MKSTYQQRPAYLDGAKVAAEDMAAGLRSIDLRLDPAALAAFVAERGFATDQRTWEGAYGHTFYHAQVVEEMKAASRDEPRTQLEDVIDRHYADDPAGEDE